MWYSIWSSSIEKILLKYFTFFGLPRSIVLYCCLPWWKENLGPWSNPQTAITTVVASGLQGWKHAITDQGQFSTCLCPKHGAASAVVHCWLHCGGRKAQWLRAAQDCGIVHGLQAQRSSLVILRVASTEGRELQDHPESGQQRDIWDMSRQWSSIYLKPETFKLTTRLIGMSACKAVWEQKKYVW